MGVLKKAIRVQLVCTLLLGMPLPAGAVAPNKLAPSSRTNEKSGAIAQMNLALLKLLEAEKNRQFREIARLRPMIFAIAEKARKAGHFDLQEGMVLPLKAGLLVPYRIGDAVCVFQLTDFANPLGPYKEFKLSSRLPVSLLRLQEETGWLGRNFNGPSFIPLLAPFPMVEPASDRLRALNDLESSAQKIMVTTKSVAKELADGMMVPKGEKKRKLELEAVNLARRIIKEESTIEKGIKDVRDAGSRTGPIYALQNRVEFIERHFCALEEMMGRMQGREMSEAVGALFDENANVDYWVARGYVFILDAQGNYVDCHKGNDFRDKVLRLQKEEGLVWVYGIRAVDRRVRAIRGMQNITLNPSFENVRTVALAYAPGEQPRLYPVAAMSADTFRRYRDQYQVPIGDLKSPVDFQTKFPNAMVGEFTRYSMVGGDAKALVLRVGLGDKATIRTVIAEAIGRNTSLAGQPLVMDTRLAAGG